MRSFIIEPEDLKEQVLAPVDYLVASACSDAGSNA